MVASPSPVQLFAKAVNENDYAAAAAWLEQLVNGVKGEVDEDYCIPIQLKETWKRGDWTKALEDGRRGVEEGLANTSDARSPRVMGLSSGTGLGRRTS